MNYKHTYHRGSSRGLPDFLSWALLHASAIVLFILSSPSSYIFFIISISPALGSAPFIPSSSLGFFENLSSLNDKSLQFLFYFLNIVRERVFVFNKYLQLSTSRVPLSFGMAKIKFLFLYFRILTLTACFSNWTSISSAVTYFPMPSKLK